MAANYIAKWNGSDLVCRWAAGWTITGLCPGGGRAGNLYAGGGFTTAGGVAANHIAKWNGTTWSALGSGTSGFMGRLSMPWRRTAQAAYTLEAGLTTAGGVAAKDIAKWNGSAWFPLGSGIGGDGSWVYALAVDGVGNLYAGGEFETAGGVAANYIAKWDGSTWSALGAGWASNRVSRPLSLPWRWTAPATSTLGGNSHRRG